jgi:acetyl esterase/lipase
MKMVTNNKFWRKYLFGLAVLVFLLCIPGYSETDPNEPFDVNIIDPNFVEPPFNLFGIDALFARDVPYGPYEDNIFDIFLVNSKEPTPLVIFIHGGGFVSGDKIVPYVADRSEIRAFLAAGCSYATINYRLLEEVDHEGVIKPMSDCKRCLQFLRYHHETLNIDPARIALTGASGGAGTSLWIAFNDDMADPNADDPVSRESTRVSVVGAKAAQSTYDIYKWETVVFAPLGLTIEDMANLIATDGSEQGLLSFYGADTIEDLSTPEYQAYRASVDMLALMSADDPPFWVQNKVENPGIPIDKGELLHHGLHAVALKERAAEVGLECQAYAPALGVTDPAGDGVVKFILDRLLESNTTVPDPNSIQGE